MVSAVVALLVGILLTIGILVFLANVIPVPAPACAPTPGGTTAAAGTTGTTGTTAGPSPAPAPAPAQAPSPAPASGKQTLKSGESMKDGEALVSPNGQSKFIYQYGIVQIMKGTQQLFASPNAPLTNGVVMLKDDGSLGLFSSQYSVTPIWGVSGSGTGPFTLSIQDDGNLLMFDATPTVVWSASISQSQASSGPTYTAQNYWVGNTGSALATGSLDACKQACTVDTTCAGFSRGISVTDTASGPCYKFSLSTWNTPGAQQQSNTWKSYRKS
jgi:hypothetical protein